MAIARSSRLYLLTISLALVCSSCGVCVPRPFISSTSPGNTTAEGNQFVLTVNGSDFRRDSSVGWNDSFRVTTFVSSHQLEAVNTGDSDLKADEVASIEHALADRPGDWRVSIVGSQANDRWEMKIFGPNAFAHSGGKVSKPD